MIHNLKTVWKNRNLTVIILNDHGMTNLTAKPLIADYLDLDEDVGVFS